MPPKVKVTKEDIIRAAVNVIRNHGQGALNARTVAAELGCSTQPVFSNFRSMEELKQAVIAAVDQQYQNYRKREMETSQYPPYKASGMAYIRFAREETELFQLLFMRNRANEAISETSDELEELTTVVQNNTGLSKEDAFRFHLEMWVYVHGIATMIATGYLQWDWDMISRMLTDAYQSMKQYYVKKE